MNINVQAYLHLSFFTAGADGVEEAWFAPLTGEDTSGGVWDYADARIAYLDARQPGDAPHSARLFSLDETEITRPA